MEQISAATLTDKPVIINQRRQGNIKKVVFDLSSGAVLGFIVNLKTMEKVAYKENVLSISNEEVVIGSGGLEPITAGSLASKANQENNHLLGLMAITESGTHFGTVIDALLLTPTLALTQVVVKDEAGERLLPKDQIKEITTEAVIFFDSVVKGHLNWQTEINPRTITA